MRNAEVIIIGPDSGVEFERFWNDRELPFIGLPDPRHKVLKLYRQKIKILKFGRMPAQAIVDRNGIIRFLHHGDSMSDIPRNEELLSILDEVNSE